MGDEGAEASGAGEDRDERDGRVRALEEEVARTRAAYADLEQLFEETTRGLYVVTERVRRQARLVASHMAMTVLLESGTLEQAAPKMLSSFGENLGWDVAALWMVDRQANCLRCTVQWRSPTIDVDAFEELSRQTVFPAGVGLPGRAWSTRSAAWIHDVVLDTNFPRAPIADRDGLHGACAFPIPLGDEITGVIELLSREARTPDEDLLLTLEALGKQLGLYLERREAEQAMRRHEMDVARSMRVSIVPRATTAPGLELASALLPAGDLGSDYHDIIPCSDGAWLAIGEVPWRGVRAGSAMLMLQSATAALVRALPESSPSVVLGELNALLLDDIRVRSQCEERITLTLVKVTADGAVSFAGTGGHLLIRRGDTGEIERHPSRGAELGVRRDLEGVFVDSTTRLGPGDHLLIVTSVLEAEDERRERFDLHRLSLAFDGARDGTCKHVCDSIAAQLLAWAPFQPHDLTLLVVRSTGPVVSGAAISPVR